MPLVSHIEMIRASPFYHALCGAADISLCDTLFMDEQEKNGGVNHLKAWRVYRKLTQEQLAEKVGTTQHQIAFLENGDRALSAKWLRRLAPALETTPGMLLDHDPANLDNDIIDIWAHAGSREKRQISDIAKAILRTGTND
jgi:transcriptional regulator with XRE-family HTH domain